MTKNASNPSRPIKSIAWLTWRSIIIGGIVAVIIGGIFGINSYGQASDAIQNREVAVGEAEVRVQQAQVDAPARMSKLAARAKALQDRYNAIVAGDRRGCPIPDDRTSSDCYVGVTEELKFAQDELERAQADLDPQGIESSQRNLRITQSDLASVKLYAGIVSTLIGIAVGLLAFGISVLIAWGYWRNRAIARQVVIGSLIAAGLGIVVGIIVGFLDYTSPSAGGYSCQTRDAVGRGLDCARNAVIHGERVGLFIALIGIGIAALIVFLKNRRGNAANPKTS